MTYDYLMEMRDLKRIDKLNKLKNPDTFWKDVIKLTRGIHNDHAMDRWQALAEIRYEEIKK